MKYENGFYIYTPNESASLPELSDPQIIEFYEPNWWLTQVEDAYSLGEITSNGTIGKMVMNDKGEVL